MIYGETVTNTFFSTLEKVGLFLSGSARTLVEIKGGHNTGYTWRGQVRKITFPVQTCILIFTFLFVMCQKKKFYRWFVFKDFMVIGYDFIPGLRRLTADGENSIIYENHLAAELMAYHVVVNKVTQYLASDICLN